MKILREQKGTRFDMMFHDYFLARKFFKGTLLREVFFTIYDRKTQQCDAGFMYITTKNTLLVRVNMQEFGEITELDQSDQIMLTPDDSVNNLHNIIETANSEIYFHVQTSNPVAFLELNNRYLLLLNIISNRKKGSGIRGAVSVTYLTGKNYIEKTENAKKAILESVNGTLIAISYPFHGLSPAVMFLNFFLINFFFYGTIMIFIIVLYKQYF